MMRATQLVSIGLAAISAMMIGACAGDESADPPKSPAGGAGGGASDAGGGAAGSGGVTGSLPLENTGDCSTGKWAGVSDACWSCMCETCADTLNSCDEACQEFMVCQSSSCFVDSQDQMSCEINCAVSECGLSPAALPAGQLDGCLIDGAVDAAAHFRRCEAECGFQYPGDICDRY